MTPPSWLYWADTGGQEGWSTYADGVYRRDDFSTSSTSPATVNLVSSAAYNTTSGAGGGIIRWYNAGGNVTTQYWQNSDTIPPFIAVWDITASTWQGVHEAPSSRPGGANETLSYSPIDTPWSNGDNGNNVIIIYLTQEPLDFSNWANYDGPLS